MVACVAGAAVEQALQDSMLDNNLPAVEFFRTSPNCCGLTHAYAMPEQHGVDRWAALLGARKLYAGPLCVVDVGTAVTVDLLTAENQHRGGRIMPGLNMMRHSLSSSTAGIHMVEGNVIQFAANTADAVTSGTLSMLIAAVEQVIREAHKDFGDTMVAVLTGGQAQIIMSEMDIKAECHLEPQLILHGLQYVAESG
jgi:type III pantothenate kinase